MKERENVITFSPKSNLVTKEQLRSVQKRIMNFLDNVVSSTYGPKNSNTMILHGDIKVPAQQVTEYTKDGHTVLKNVIFDGVIENSIQNELTEITHHVEQVVGDGTTSAVKLSAAIFNLLCKMEENNESSMTPYQIIRNFQDAVENIKNDIRQRGTDITLDDIYNITMISTNGNTMIADYMKTIYEKYGFDVFIDVGISTSVDSYIKEYDGMTLEVGYSDPAYVNTIDKTSRIQNARVYYFTDPIDTPEMVSLFETIINKNIITPVNAAEQYDGIAPIPTVIVAPTISRDMSSLLKQTVSFLHQFSSMIDRKPPLLIITNLGPYQEDFEDIAHLCGVKEIRKYIDPKIQEADVQKGLAPTLETVCDFYGECEVVESDTGKTKFINPKNMYTDQVDENGNPIYTTEYNTLMNFLQKELEDAQRDGKDNNVVGRLKRRINSLKANMVEFLIGGIEIADRDSLRALVEDAVLNCRSAARNGVGYAANFEGYIVSKEWASKDTELKEFYQIVNSAYKSVVIDLYSTVDPAGAEKLLEMSEELKCPMNLVTGNFDHKVLTSIETDITIIDAIAKIVTIMFSANQALVQGPFVNVYNM